MQDDAGDGVQFNQAEHAARMVGYPPQGLHEFHFEFENWHGLWIKTGNADPLSTGPVTGLGFPQNPPK